MAGYIEEAVDAGRRGLVAGCHRHDQHAGRQPRRHATDRLQPARGAGADDRVGRAERRARGQRRHVHHPRREPRLHVSGTNIGAASPVGAGGAELEGTIGDKVRNDAMKNIRAIAEARGRDVDWAVSTVEKAVSASASEAVAVGAVDGIATSLEDVRRQADGKVVEVRAQPVTVDIADAPFVDLPMNPFQSIIHLLSDPNVAFILLTLGFYGSSSSSRARTS